MQISARNILPGIVDNVIKGAVNAEVDLTLQGGERMVAIITNASVDAMTLSRGCSAFAIVKASDVIVGKGVNGGKFSARNVLMGVVTKVQEGAVNSEVIIQIRGGAEVAASITKVSALSLALKDGDGVSAIIKASNVMIGV